MMAFAGMIGITGERRRGRTTHRAAQTGFRAARQARDLPVHERRAVAGGQLRSEARAREISRPAAARRNVATERKTGTLMKSPFTFKKYGQCGMEVSELFPHVGECADDICLIRSVYTDIPNHEPSMLDDEHRSQPGGPSIAWARGSPMAWAPKTRICRDTWCCVPMFQPRLGRRCGATRFCPPIHQGTYISDKVIEKQTEDTDRQEVRPEES